MSQLFTGKGNPFYGKQHTQETKTKMSITRRKKDVEQKGEQKNE